MAFFGRLGDSYGSGFHFKTYLVSARTGVKVDIVEFEILHAEGALLWLVVRILVQNRHGEQKFYNASVRIQDVQIIWDVSYRFVEQNFVLKSLENNRLTQKIRQGRLWTAETLLTAAAGAAVLLCHKYDDEKLQRDQIFVKY